MRDQHYNYCPHGVYVGGCGIDWMCGECESGEDAPTLNETLDYIASIYSRTAKRAQRALTIFDPTAVSIFLPYLWSGAAKEIAAQQALANEIREWTADPDDSDWIFTRHKARVREFMEATSNDCEHGLDAANCFGPGHYDPRA